MKIFKIIAILLLFCTVAFGQKPRLAVVVDGKELNAGAYKQFSGQVVAFINTKYAAVDRSAQALSVLRKEHEYQRSGAVDDKQIKALGKQFEVSFLCIVSITKSISDYYLEAKLIDVETAEYVPAFANSKLESSENLTSAARSIADQLLGVVSAGNVGGATPPSGGSRGSSADNTFTDSRDGKVGLDMIFVQGGTFTMGCTSEQGSDCLDGEKPAHSVTVSDYYIGKFPVTQRQWVAVMGSNPSHFKGDDLPVENVSWTDIQGFISKLRQVSGKRYRLLTEAEWEYAARGGSKSKGFKYAGGNRIADVAWYTDNSGAKTHPVGLQDPNELGIHDMSGNVWEWVSDWFGSYSSGSKVDPSGPSSGSDRVIRGGSWDSFARLCRVAGRHSYSPGYRFNIYGFRLALSP